MREIIEQVCRAFCIEGTLQTYTELKQGNINHTYRVDFHRPDGSVFKKLSRPGPFL